jgi:hypothetical protein
MNRYRSSGSKLVAIAYSGQKPECPQTPPGAGPNQVLRQFPDLWMDKNRLKSVNRLTISEPYMIARKQAKFGYEQYSDDTRLVHRSFYRENANPPTAGPTSPLPHTQVNSGCHHIQRSPRHLGSILTLLQNTEQQPECGVSRSLTFLSHSIDVSGLCHWSHSPCTVPLSI